MPVPSVEKVQKREAALKSVLAEQAESMEPARRRRAVKQLKRAQRKRRRLAEKAKRHAAKPSDSSSMTASSSDAAQELAPSVATSTVRLRLRPDFCLSRASGRKKAPGSDCARSVK